MLRGVLRQRDQERMGSSPQLTREFCLGFLDARPLRTQLNGLAGNAGCTDALQLFAHRAFGNIASELPDERPERAALAR